MIFSPFFKGSAAAAVALKYLASNPWARHAPPHVPRADQPGYDELKKRWGERLRTVLLRHYPQLEEIDRKIRKS